MRFTLQVDTKIRAADAGAAELKGNRGPPSALVRVASAFLYIVPWIDVLSLGREVYHFFPASLLLYLIPGTPPAQQEIDRWVHCRMQLQPSCCACAPTWYSLGQKSCLSRWRNAVCGTLNPIMHISSQCLHFMGPRSGHFQGDGMSCRTSGAIVLQRPVCAPHRVLPPLPGHREEQ